MTARSSNIALENLTKGLVRWGVPRLPPAPGFDGEAEHMKQVEIWKKWIEWEKEDPLVLKEEDLPAYKARVLYVYKQAVMSLRFWPEMWFDAAEFCYQNGMEAEGDKLLDNGVAANPESCLLAFKKADRVEHTTATLEGTNVLKKRGDAVQEPYQKLLDSLYELINKARTREAQTIGQMRDNFAQQATTDLGKGDDEDEEDEQSIQNKKEAALQAQIDLIQKGTAIQIKLLSKTISFAWIALMRSMRRIQGKGKVGDPIGGCRQVFGDARRKGRITSDVYVASALIEFHCYKDPAASKIFERGMKLFPEDENFALEYIKHLIATNDVTSRSCSQCIERGLTNSHQMHGLSSRQQ